MNPRKYSAQQIAWAIAEREKGRAWPDITREFNRRHNYRLGYGRLQGLVQSYQEVRHIERTRLQYYQEPLPAGHTLSWGLISREPWPTYPRL
jgi:hypothetical protein